MLMICVHLILISFYMWFPLRWWKGKRKQRNYLYEGGGKGVPEARWRRGERSCGCELGDPGLSSLMLFRVLWWQFENPLRDIFSSSSFASLLYVWVWLPWMLLLSTSSVAYSSLLLPILYALFIVSLSSSTVSLLPYAFAYDGIFWGCLLGGLNAGKACFRLSLAFGQVWILVSLQVYCLKLVGL